MRVLVNVFEAGERLEELIALALRGDEVLICRAEQPIAVLEAVPRTGERTKDAFLRLAAEGRASVPDGTTANHDDLYDEHGLPI